MQTNKNVTKSPNTKNIITQQKKQTHTQTKKNIKPIVNNKTNLIKKNII